MRARTLLESTIAVLLLACPALAGPVGRGAFPEAARYQRALENARARPKVDVEALFALAERAAEEIRADLERVDAARAAGIEAAAAYPSLDGLVIRTEEVLVAVPDPRFFAPLAAAKGRPVDQEFVALLSATRPDGVWPAYLEQQTDVTGCARFDLPALAAIYAGWLELQRRSPRAYRDAIARELHALDQALLDDCACGPRSTVEAGLRAFTRALPGAAITPRLQARLEEVRAGTAPIAFECRGG